MKTLVQGVREFREDFRDDRRRQEEMADSRREDQRREEFRRRQEEDDRQRREDERRQQAIMTVMNDDTIEITPEERRLINNPEMKMMSDGTVVKRTRSRGGLGSGAFAAQFSVLRGQLPKAKKAVRKKARKELDRLQAQAFKEANRLLRTKAGKLRKGVTQSDVAKRAQKILKKLRK